MKARKLNKRNSFKPIPEGYQLVSEGKQRDGDLCCLVYPSFKGNWIDTGIDNCTIEAMRESFKKDNVRYYVARPIRNER